MKITCIDFETANPFWGSVCAVGLAVIEEGKIVKTVNMLVKPHPDHNEFNIDNIRVHGIKPGMVKDAPEFDVVYGLIKQYIEDSVLAAHNTGFDIECLKDVLTIYNIPIPAFEYICTCEISRKSWQGLKNYKLKTVSTFLSHKFRHHNAGEDACASANIVLKAMEQAHAGDIYRLAESLGVKIGAATGNEKHILSSVTKAQKLADRINAWSISPENGNFNPAHPFYNKELVFTGRFSKGVGRRQVMQLAVNAGAKLSNYVRGATGFLVQGAGEYDGSSNGESAKTRKAKKMIETGSDIKIINETDFYVLLGK